MTRRTEVEALLRRYGIPVQSGSDSFRAVVRPLRFSGNGEKTDSFYVGPAAYPLGAGGTLSVSGSLFTVRRSESVSLGGEPLYTRAVLRAVPGHTVTVETASGTAASAESCSAKAVRQSGTPVSFGESEPYDIAQGAVSYEVALGGVTPAAGISLSSLSDFQIVIRGGKTVITYSGCQWKEEAESGGGTAPFARSLTALACSKQETQTS